jgi:hypothetical protein
MRELSQSPDKLAYYREKKEKLEPVLYPEPSSYHVIKIPVIPYPIQILIRIKEVLERRKFPLESIDMNIATHLRDLGYIRFSRRYGYLMRDGEDLLRMLRSVVG